MPTTAKLHRSESLGPNIQSRLEALEAAMGVRLNLAKSQGRHSLMNTASPSPMQLSPTSSANTTLTNINPLSTSSRHSLASRISQGVQRSASSCDADHRPGPIKRHKPSIPNENLSPSSSSTAASIATIKKYPPSARRSLLINTTNQTSNRSLQNKQSPPIKQRTSPMETSSPRLSRASTTSTTSSSYRTPVGGISPKISNSPAQISSPPSRPPTMSARKRSMSVFGEQFSPEILKLNLLWIDFKELDDDSRSEVILQFGSIENFLCEQQLFFHKQQQQLKLAAKNKTSINRSHLHLSLPKKDRLELL